MRELEKHGWRVGMGLPHFDKSHGFGMILAKDKTVHGWDILVFKLIMRKEIASAMPIAKALGQKIVVDIDDFFDGLDESNQAHAVTDPRRNSDNNTEHYNNIIAQADAIITSTPFLYDYYSKKYKNVFLVRNGIDISRWNKRYDRAGNRPTIGWVGATPWRSRDLETLNPWMGSFIEKNKLSFHHSGHLGNGSPFARDQLKINKRHCSETPLSPINEYPKLFLNMDIGLVPLNDVPFNHAKSYIKGLEYAAAGVPFVASSAPEYQFLADAGIGRVANNEEEWKYHLTELLNPQMRKDEAMINYELVRDMFSMKVRGADWSSTMERIMKL
jgi:glycosyltransferase involved in cell wall biosynthesis